MKAFHVFTFFYTIMSTSDKSSGISSDKPLDEPPTMPSLFPLLLSLLLAICLSLNACGQDPGAGLASLTGNFTDHGVDVDHDGLYEYLTIEAVVDVFAPGEYSLNGYLLDSNGKEVAWSIDHRNFSIGEYRMALNFDGKTIRRHGASRYYRLGDLVLSRGSSYSGMLICQRLNDSNRTYAYNYTQFDV